MRPAEAQLERRGVVDDPDRGDHPVVSWRLEQRVQCVHLIAARARPRRPVRLFLVVFLVVEAPGDPPRVRRLEIHANHVLAPRVYRRPLARVVEAAPAARVRLRVDLQRVEAGLVDPVRRNPPKHAAIGEAPARVGGATRQTRCVVLDVGEQVAAAVDRLREVAGSLEGGRYAGQTLGHGIVPPLEFLAPEEEEPPLVRIERAGDVDGTADGVAAVVAARFRFRRIRPVVEPRVRVPIGAAAVPVARAMEVLRAALGDDLHLTADRAAVLGLVGVREDLELRDGVDIERRHVAAVVAGVDVGDAVDRHVVRVRALPVHGEAADCRRRLSAHSLLHDAGYERREGHERTLTAGDVLQRLAVECEGALAGRRLQLRNTARDRDFFRHLADFHREDSG